MSNLIPKTQAQSIAERIDRRQSELLNHVQSTLRALYQDVDTNGLQQEILDAFGNNAAQAVQKYGAMYQAIKAIDPDADIIAPDPTVFVIKPDGTVEYVAPPEPEPEPEPEPAE